MAAKTTSGSGFDLKVDLSPSIAKS